MNQLGNVFNKHHTVTKVVAVGIVKKPIFNHDYQTKSALNELPKNSSIFEGQVDNWQ